MDIVGLVSIVIARQERTRPLRIIECTLQTWIKDRKGFRVNRIIRE